MPELSPPERDVLTLLKSTPRGISRDTIAELPTCTVGAIPTLVRRKLAAFDDAGESFGLTYAGQVIAEEAL